MWLYLAIIGGGSALYAGGSFVAAFGYLRPPRLVGSLPADFRPAEWRTISIAGCPTLASQPRTNKEKIGIVLAHGWGGGQATWASLGQRLSDRGFAVMIPSFPGHDDNKGANTTFGVSESKVVIDLAKKLREMGCERVIGVGVSMGAASLWLSVLQEQDALDGIVSEGAFSTLDSAIPTWNAGRLPLGEYVLAPAAIFAERIAGIRAESVRPVDGARAFRGKPCLVLNCELDRLVPLPNAVKIAESAGVEVTNIPKAKHADGYVSDPEAYERMVLNLVEQVK